MRKIIKIVVAGLLLAVLTLTHLNADVIELKNGGKIHGAVVRETKDMVEVDVGKGQIFLNREDIKSIKKSLIKMPRKKEDSFGRAKGAGLPIKISFLPFFILFGILVIGSFSIYFVVSRAKKAEKPRRPPTEDKSAEEVNIPAIEGAMEAEEKKEIPSFFAYLPASFAYPFRGNGVLLLILGTIFFMILNVLKMSFFMVGIFWAVFGGGYLASYMMKIIHHAATGKEDVPGWPGFTDFFSDIIHPLVLVIGTSIMCFLPTLVYVVIIFNGWLPPVAAWGTPVFVVLGSLYFPMALLAAVMFGSVGAAVPTIVVPSIARAPKEYFVTLLVIAVIYLLKAAGGTIASVIPFVGGALSNFIALYFLVVEMRILGLLYYTKSKKLGWFE